METKFGKICSIFFILLLSLTLYACKNKVFSEEWFKITFETNRGTFLNDIVIRKNYELSILEEPTKTDFTFAGWYLDQNLTEEVIFPLIINDNKTFYAKWKPNGILVTFLNIDNEIFKEIVVEKGQSLANIEAPIVEDDIFIKWSHSLNNINEPITVIPYYFSNNSDLALENQYNYSLIATDDLKSKHFLDLQFPLGLGLPKLSDTEINYLVGQNIEYLKEKITTVADLYSYLIAANFNKNVHPDVPNLNNYYYSEEYEEEFFIFESGPLALALNYGGCAGVASIVKYILEDHYDEIGFFFWHADDGGHSFNYIKINGLYYIVDFTQLKNITMPSPDWFNFPDFPVIYKNLLDWVNFNIEFRNTHQSNWPRYFVYGIFRKNNPYIPNSWKIWDYENTHFVLTDPRMENGIQGEVIFKTHRELLTALELNESHLIFPYSIDLD